MSKRSFLKAMVVASAMLSAISSGACTGDDGKLSVEKARAVAAHADTLDVYKKRLVELNGGVVDADSVWDRVRREFTEVRDRSSYLASVELDIDGHEVVLMAHADSAVFNFMHDVRTFAGDLKSGRIKTFEQYSSGVFDLSGRYDRIEKSLELLHAGGLSYPLVRDELGAALISIESDAHRLLAEAQAAGRDVERLRGQARTGYSRIFHVLDRLQRKFT